MYKLQKISFLILTIVTINLSAQSTKDSLVKKKKYQAKPSVTIQFGKEAFVSASSTTIRWLGMAGFFVNSRGTNFMMTHY